jgi:hypothetical protein
MKFKNSTVMIQLLFVIVVVAVLATHFRIFQVKELYADAIGVSGADKNLVVPGSIFAPAAGQYIGETKLPDLYGNVVIKPGGGTAEGAIPEIKLDGTTVVGNNQNLCFQTGPNKDCYSGTRLAQVDRVPGLRSDLDSLKNDTNKLISQGLLDLGTGVSRQADAGKIRYGGWDNSALNIVGAGNDGFNRKVRVWDNLCIGNTCMNASEYAAAKQSSSTVNGFQSKVDGEINGLKSEMNNLSNRVTNTSGTPKRIHSLKGLSAGQRRCIDIPYADPTNGRHDLIIWDCHDGANQKWTYTENRQIKSAMGNKCLDALGGTDRLGVWDCDKGSINQKFIYNPTTGAYHWEKVPNKCVDLPFGNINGGTKIKLHPCNGTEAQRFSGV